MARNSFFYYITWESNSCCCLVCIFDTFYFDIIFVHNFISASFLWNPKYVPHSWMLMNYLPLFDNIPIMKKESCHWIQYIKIPISKEKLVFNIFLAHKTYPKMKQFSFSMNMSASSFWKKKISFLFCNKIGFFFFFKHCITTTRSWFQDSFWKLLHT